MTEKEKMLAGLTYVAADAELDADRQRAKSLCARYNRGAPARDLALLAELLGYETDAYLEPPFHCDYGYQLRLGRGVYANHNLIVLDCAPVTIGDRTMLGPNVVLATAGHPLDPAERAAGLEFAAPITLGADVWVGASVTLVGGVEVGDGTTIGAGSVVTRSLPARCLAFGNPCRVVRML